MTYDTIGELPRYRMSVEFVHHALSGREGDAEVRPHLDPAGEWVKADVATGLLSAAKRVLAQFEAISRHQHEKLVLGQTLESAAANWDEATLGHHIDFQPLMDAVAKAEGR